MIKLLLESVNLLILDEPTNHLDMRSKDVLKEAIREFDGTVIIVSHDREFLDGLVTKVYEFGEGKVKEHLGGIYDFLQSKRIDNLDSLGTKPQNLSSTPSTQKAEAKFSSGVSDYAMRKEQAKQQRKLQKRVEECEKRVSQIEAELKELEEWMATPTGASNPALFEQYGKLKETLAQAEAEWEEAMMAMEE
jgi:ATP-binding cassette subfamily F protein 3